MGRVTVRRPVLTLSARGERQRHDTLAAEEPLELRVGGRALAVTMRTPGHDVELAHGFLLTEGVISSPTDVRNARFCDARDERGLRTYNMLDVELADGVPAPAPGAQRNFYTSSSCGVCGKASLDAVRLRTRFSPAADPMTVTPTTLATLPGALRAAQRVFEATGGLHAAGLFTTSGDLLVVREDVGRHNAVDKVLGWALLTRCIPATGCVLMVSGRASFELVQKAVMAGIPMLAAVSAPSSLAVELASDAGLTLIGFLRGPSMNVYTGLHRIDRPEHPGATPKRIDRQQLACHTTLPTT
ncbi:MAG TPA: formate dehydrogenase accessory sulfurtransferase FdhD [Pseudonocardiaceae bacterium]|nr:formate dehydrogenase accessory sulfurtransferase FdhD [Pseudonocardiaceae bacterium]